MEKLFVAAPLRLAVLVVGSNAVARLHVAFRLNADEYAFAFSRTCSVLKERMIFAGSVIFQAALSVRDSLCALSTWQRAVVVAVVSACV